MPNSPRLKWPYPRKDQDPYYEPFEALVNAADASSYAATEDRNTLALGGGTFSYTAASGSISWDGTIELLAANTGFLWSAQPDDVVLEEGQILYVDLPRAPSDNVSVSAVVASNLSDVPSLDSAFVLAVRRNGKVYFRNGRVMGDGDAFEVFETTGVGGGGGGGSGGSNVLIFKPGSGASGPIVYASWTALMGQLAALRSASNNSGQYVIIFDNSVTSITIPAGAYDMTLVEWRGQGRAAVTPISVAQGASFTKLRRVTSGAGITFAGATSPITDISDGDRFVFEGNSGVTCSGIGIFFDLSSLSGTAVLTLDGSFLTNAGSRCITNVTTALTIEAKAGSSVGLNTVSGPGTLTIRVDEESTAVETQASMTTVVLTASPQRFPFLLQAANFAAVSGFVYNVDTSSGNKSVALPLTVNNKGSIIVVKHVSSSNTITVNATGSDTIDGAASYVISVAKGAVTLISNGGSPGLWSVVSERVAPSSGPTPGQRILRSTAMALSVSTDQSSFQAFGNFPLNPTDYAISGTTVDIKFLVVGLVTDSTTTGQIQLFNLTDVSLVSTLNFTGSGDTTPTKKISSTLSLPSSEKMYEVRIRVTGGAPPDKVFAQWAGFQIENVY